MKTYKSWLSLFNAHDLLDFTLTEEGLLWLKLRSIERKDLLAAFCAGCGFSSEEKAKGSLEILWKALNEDERHRMALDSFLSDCQRDENRRIDRTFESIRSNLYQMEEFHWGGGFRNSLDRAIVSRYVKTDKIIPYGQLDGICDGELRTMSRGYLLNSWYDYWSSVLIENVFRRNPRVMPAPGKIKNVDFFVCDVPFDLKVTYFPKEFEKRLMKRKGIPSPLKLLRGFARRSGIPFADVDDDRQIYEIEQRILDSHQKDGISLLQSIRADRERLVRETMAAPGELVQWLYENQGDMRFGAENRVFLILIDLNDPRSSWKLKRNVDLIRPSVDKWIHSFRRSGLDAMKVRFSYKGREFTTFATTIFVCK